jgi:hypothetical protein
VIYGVADALRFEVFPEPEPHLVEILHFLELGSQDTFVGEISAVTEPVCENH